MLRLKLLTLVTLLLCFTFPSAHAGVITNFQYLSAVESHEKGRFTEAARKFERLLTVSDPAISGQAAFQLFEYYFDGAPGIPQSHAKALQYLELAYNSRDRSWSAFAANRKAMHAHFGIEGLVEVNRVAALKYYQESKSKSSSQTADRGIRELMRYPDVYASIHP
jgi:hypothetical protein